MTKFSEMLILAIGLVSFCFVTPAQARFNFITPGKMMILSFFIVTIIMDLIYKIIDLNCRIILDTKV